ncbi:MAG: hypothetical protein GW886_13010 [Rhodobacterales bacterium]|nr:hypothetical protein [Rhodobacterales bacterium]NCT11578.1 hypothetical protein [Rhodobacterales bacterium]
MRRVEVAHLSPSGTDIRDFSRLVPALPAFEEAFAAFARGTLMSTDRGLVAVEDLLPGDRVRTVDDGFQTLLWHGRTMIVPQAQGQDPVMTRLTRIAADALGIARPMTDLLLGPRARLVHRAPGIRKLTGADLALVPARDFVDGINLIGLTPVAPTPVCHLGFARHHRLVANGVEVESFHPGPMHALGLRGDLLDLYMSCFPHIAGPDAFGAAILPRLRMADLDLFDVA